MGRPFTVLLDIDGPLAGFDEHLFALSQKHGWEFKDGIFERAHQKSRYLTDDMANSQHRRMARDLCEAAGWFRSLPVIAGAQEGVDEMLTRGWCVFLCTKPLAANPTCRDEKYAWVCEHFPALKDRLIITPDKSIVYGDVLLDDAIKISWIQDAFWEPVVFDAPFNREGSIWANLPRFVWGEPVDNLFEFAAVSRTRRTAARTARLDQA